MQLMQPQADIDELELDAILQILLYLLFQWLALFQQMNSGSPMDLERMYRISLHLSLGPDRASTLPMYYALTECDTVSFFEGRGKKNS